MRPVLILDNFFEFSIFGIFWEISMIRIIRNKKEGLTLSIIKKL